MMRHLPEGSRYAAIMSAPMDGDEARPLPEPDPEALELYNRRFWTQDRRMAAMQLNALRDLTLVTGNWPKDKQPKFPVIGPAEWRGEKPAKKAEPITNNDVLKALGWNGVNSFG